MVAERERHVERGRGAGGYNEEAGERRAREQERGLKRNIVMVLIVALSITLLITAGVMNSRSRKLKQMERGQQVELIPSGPGTGQSSSAAGGGQAGSAAPEDEDASMALKGKMAPGLVLKDLDGKTVDLKDYRGKAVLVNFWATWCAPCKIELPWLVKLRDQYGPQGFEVLGVAADDAPKAEIAKSAKQYGLSYPVLVEGLTVADKWGGLDSLPTSFYIDRDGKISDVTVGLYSRDELEANIKKLVTAPAGNAGGASPTAAQGHS
jgi:thiol-disulfide isomerase/thioredoxin